MTERIFKAYDVRGTYPDMISEDDAWKIGYATALYMQRSRQGGFAAKVRLESTICVGRDISSPFAITRRRHHRGNPRQRHECR